MKIQLYFIFSILLVAVDNLWAQDPLDTALDNLSQQIVSSTAMEENLTIAVMDFSGLEGQTTDLNKYLPEELITRLFRTGRFEVVERRLLTKIFAELKLSLTEIFDLETIKELGQMLEADAIVTGTITDLGTSLRIHIRIISTETGELYGAAGVSLMKTKKVLKLLGQKIPGRLKIFTFPSGATIRMNNKLKRLSERKGTVLEISPGFHTIVLSKAGFKDFKKALNIAEDESRTLKVKFVTHPFAPFKASLLSAIIPGFGAYMYGGRIIVEGVYPGGVKAIASYASTGFYISALCYLIDKIAKPETFLCKGYENRYDDIVKKQLYVMGGFYITNVIFSFFVGMDYAQTHKVGIEVSLDTPDSAPGVSLVYRFK